MRFSCEPSTGVLVLCWLQTYEHLVEFWRHDLLVRQRVPKWQTPQAFDDRRVRIGAGEWARTIDLLITKHQHTTFAKVRSLSLRSTIHKI